MQEDIRRVFSTIEDPRVVNRCDHKLIDILFIALCTLLSNGEDFMDMVEFGKQREAWLRQYLELPNGIPAHDTFNRVFQIVDSEQLKKCLEEDGRVLLESLEDELINLDGKKLRGESPKSKGNKGLWILSAWVGKHRLCIGQKKVKEKSNEIIAIPELLQEIDITGSIVSIDAIGCQSDIAESIIKSDADYHLAVKSNQKDLLEEIQEAFDWMSSEDFSEQWEYDHNRYEERKCFTLPACENLSPNNLEKWKEVKALVKIESSRQIKGVKSSETRYYINSKENISAEKCNEISRGHWSIENHLHWHLDVTFKEDDCRSRTGNAPENLNILRKVALHRLTNMTGKASLKKKRYRASMNTDYLEKVMGF